jgi:hypothetical protein
VSSLLNGAKASVTVMGRGMSSSAYEKHRIKQADRLLSNKHIVNEQLPIYLLPICLSIKQSIRDMRMLHHVLLF